MEPQNSDSQKTENEKQNTSVHIARSIEPEKQELSEAIKIKHDRSVQSFPELNLSYGEYVILCVMKHKIALIAPLGASVILLVVAIVMAMNMDIAISFLNELKIDAARTSDVYFILGWTAILSLILMYSSYYIYIHNRFILTNESIIQETQRGLLSHNEQTVSLANVEDASYTQGGLFQQMFNYGSLRLSTEGDETTYKFNYVYDPRGKIKILNNAVEAFKNGRPIEED